VSQASTAPFDFKAAVKNDPAKLLKGQLQCCVSSHGLRLQQGKKLDLLLPVGTAASCGDDGRLRVPIEGREVELTATSWALYPQRLARDLCAFLQGRRPPLVRHDYTIPPYLYVPAVLPLGIPVLTLGGALWAGLGFGLAGACTGIIRREQWPVAARVASVLGLSAAGYAVVFAVLLLVVKPAWLVESKPNQPAPAPVDLRGEPGQIDTWKAEIDPKTGKMVMDSWNDNKNVTHYSILPGIDQKNLNPALAPKVLPGEPVVLKKDNVPIFRMAFAPDGKTLATLDEQTGACRLWDTATGKERASFFLNWATAGWFTFSPDGKYFVAWDGTGKAPLRSPETGEVVRHLDTGDLQGGRASDCDFAPDGKLFAGIGDGKIRFWRMPEAEPVNYPHVSAAFAKPQRILHFLRFGLDSKTLLTTSGGDDASSKRHRFDEVWNLEKPEPARLLRGFTDDQFIAGLELSLDRKLVLSSNHGNGEVLDWATDRITHGFDDSRGSVASMATTPDGQTLVAGHGPAGAGAPNLSLWDLRSRKLVAAYHLPTPATVTLVAVSADGKLLAAVLANGVGIWKLDAILAAK